MEIRYRTSGSFYPDLFATLYPFMNEFVPLYIQDVAMSNLEFPKEEQKCYALPSFEENRVIHKANSIKNILSALEYSLALTKFEINGNIYYIMKGVIFNVAKKPLLVVGMKKNWKDVNLNKWDIPDYNNYILFYSTTFLTNPSLAAFNRRLQKSVLLSCFTKGMEVRLIDPAIIEKNTFARVFEKPFKSISELNHHLKHTLPLFLKPKGEDTSSLEGMAVGIEDVEIFETMTVEEEARLLGFMSNENQESVGGQNTDSEMTYQNDVDYDEEDEEGLEDSDYQGDNEEGYEDGETVGGADYYQEHPVTFQNAGQIQTFGTSDSLDGSNIILDLSTTSQDLSTTFLNSFPRTEIRRENGRDGVDGVEAYHEEIRRNPRDLLSHVVSEDALRREQEILRQEIREAVGVPHDFLGEISVTPSETWIVPSNSTPSSRGSEPVIVLIDDVE